MLEGNGALTRLRVGEDGKSGSPVEIIPPRRLPQLVRAH